MPYYTWKKIIVYLVVGIIIGYFGRGLLGGTYTDGWRDAGRQVDGEDFGKIVTTNEAGEEVVQYKVVGRIISLTDDKIIMNSDVIGVLADRDSLERTVKVDEDTKITIKQDISKDYWYEQVNPELKQELKDLEEKLANSQLDRDERDIAMVRIEEINQELAEQQRAMIADLRQQLSTATDETLKQSLQQRLTAITSNTMVNPLTIRDLKSGDSIVVLSSKDIRYDHKFTAEAMQVMR